MCSLIYVRFIYATVAFKLLNYENDGLETSLWARVLAACMEVLAFVPSTHIRWLETACSSSSRGSDILLWTLKILVHTWCTYRQAAIHTSQTIQEHRMVMDQPSMLAGVANHGCQLDQIRNQLGNKMLTTSTRDFLCQVISSRNTYPKCGCHHWW